MLAIRLSPSLPPAPRCALENLLEGIGVRPAPADSGGPLPRIEFGSFPPPDGGVARVLIPADAAAWGAKGSPSPTALRPGPLDIVLDRDILAPVHRGLGRGEDLPTRPEEARGAAPGRSFLPPALAMALDSLGSALRAAFHRMGLPWVTTDPWPAGRPFALFLSHDVDQVYDREVHYALTNLNHLLNTVRGRTGGDARLALRRIARTIFAPKPVRRDFETIRKIEARHGWRSTFFFLQDRTWARYGQRYRLADPEMRDLLAFLRNEGCEAGVHGGYYAFNDCREYGREARAIECAWGARPEGIRNHYLRWSYPRTWQAQAEAGLTYDSTLGFSDRPGYRAGYGLPFRPYDPDAGRRLPLLEIPLALMDNTIFQYLRCGFAEAMDLTRSALRAAERSGSVLTLLWHNNYFNDPEFQAWQETYTQTLQEAADAGPWCATGGEIAGWWRARAGLALETVDRPRNGWTGRLTAAEGIRSARLRLEAPATDGRLAVEGAEARVLDEGGTFTLDLPLLPAGGSALVRMTWG